MFLDNLSTSILQLCDEKNLTYESASEQCKLSARYFGDIARGQTAPTILTLEKLCSGLNVTPNDLLLSADMRKEIAMQQFLLVSRTYCTYCPYASEYRMHLNLLKSM